MLTLTKKVEFALIVLKYFDENDEFNPQTNTSVVIKAQEIAQIHNISENFVAKIMQKLCQKQILLSKQGAQGGYYLNKDLNQISLLQLLEVLEGYFSIVNCINESKVCVYDQGCTIVDPMRHLNSLFRKTYQNITLAEILRPYQQSQQQDRGGENQGDSDSKEKILLTQSKSSREIDKNQLIKNLSIFKDIVKMAGTKILVKFFQWTDSLKLLYSKSFHNRSKLSWFCLFLTIFIFKGISAAEVNIYSYRQKFLIQEILKKFTETTGIKANVIFIDKGLVERIKLEGRRSPADVILTTDIGQLADLEEKDIVQPLRNATIESVIPNYLRHSKGLWFALTTRARIIYTSKDRVKKGEIRNYIDLAQPKWKNRICIRSGYHPYNLALFSSLVAHNGKNTTEKFLKQLRNNLARKPQGNDRAQIKAIKEGLCDVSIGNSYYYALMLYNHESPEEIEWAKSVRLVFPNQDNQGTHYNVSGMALARYSPNSKEAVKLMEFLTSDLAQYIYASENYEFPVKKGIPLPPFLRTYMADVKWDIISLEKIATERRRVTLLLDKIQFDL